MIEELKLKQVQINESDLNQLKSLLNTIGATLVVEPIHSNDVTYPLSKITIQYDSNVVSRKIKRDAGRKRIQTDLYYTIGEIKQRVKTEGLPAVLDDLNISESTYYRRMRYYKTHKIDDSEFFQ